MVEECGSKNTLLIDIPNKKIIGNDINFNFFNFFIINDF